MDTIVYVDGFNLYYGSLRGTPFKWLDLCAYFRATLPSPCRLVKVKYFTARISALPSDPSAPDRQAAYLDALRAACGPAIEIIEGHFQVKSKRLPLAASPGSIVEVLAADEKGSDVNLAVELVNDAWANAFDCAVVVSNDADLERAMRIAKLRKRKVVHLVTPGFPRRRPLNCLKRWANRHGAIDPVALAANQLPATIPATSIARPSRW